MVQRCAEGDDKHFRGGDILPYSGCAADTHFTTAVPTATALTEFPSENMGIAGAGLWWSDGEHHSDGVSAAAAFGGGTLA